MLALHVLFVALLVGTEGLFTLLAVLNLRHGERAIDEEADWFEERVDADPDRIVDYQRTTTGLGRLRAWTGLVVLLLALYSGLVADVATAFEATGWPPLLADTAFLVTVLAATRVWSLPFDAVDTFVVEELFGFNNQTPPLWVRDRALWLVIGLVIAGLVGGAVLAAIRTFPALWWVVAWALLVGFSLVMLVVYPRVIAPLFNDFEKVESGDLRDAVDDVFERAGFSCEQVYVMDASRRSSHANAYFVGFGRAKRVVLFDTLVDQLSTEQLQSVLAHELAHWKRAHVWKQIAATAVQGGVVLVVLQYLVGASWPAAMFGLPADATAAALVVALVWVAPLNRLAAPLTNRLALRYEYEADAFAADVVGDGRPLAESLYRLTEENLANPFPHPAYAAFHHTHPPVPERARALREGGRTDDEGGADDGAGPAESTGAGIS